MVKYEILVAVAVNKSVTDFWLWHKKFAVLFEETILTVCILIRILTTNLRSCISNNERFIFNNNMLFE